MTRATIAVIRIYQRLQQALTAQHLGLLAPAGCRSWPTCSEYTIQAVREQGITKGLLQGMIRIVRCNPLFGPQQPTP